MQILRLGHLPGVLVDQRLVGLEIDGAAVAELAPIDAQSKQAAHVSHIPVPPPLLTQHARHDQPAPQLSRGHPGGPTSKQLDHDRPELWIDLEPTVGFAAVAECSLPRGHTPRYGPLTRVREECT